MIGDNEKKEFVNNYNNNKLNNSIYKHKNNIKKINYRREKE